MAAEGRLDELLAKEEIREVVYRYCRAADRCDGEMMRSVFHPDATERHDSLISAAQFCDEVIPRLLELWTGTQHLIGQVRIELDGDVAAVESYFLASHLRAPDEDGQVTIWQLGGRYCDRFERRDGAWLIAHRLLVADWEDTRTVREARSRPFVRQSRGSSDPSCEVFGR